MLKKIKFETEYLILILIIVSNLILRLWKLAELFHFTYDESVFAFVGKRMFVNGHVPLIGGVTPMHVHLGPFFYWLSGVILFIFKFNPLGWGIFAAVVSLLTIVLLFILVKELFSSRVALLATLIYSFSTLINIYDRHYWGLMFNPLLSLAVLESLFKIIKGQKLFFIFLTLALSFGFHTDPSTWVFFILVLLIFFKYKPSLKNRYFYFSLFIFFLSFLPLIVFDLRHSFVNIKGIFQYIPEARESIDISSSRFVNSLLFIPVFLSRILQLTYGVDLAKEYSYCRLYVDEKLFRISPYLLIIALLMLFFGISKKNLLLNYFIFVVFFGIFVYAGLLGRPFFEHYLSTLIPVLVIFVALSVDRIINISKISGVFVLLVFLIVNLFSFTKVYHSYGFALQSEVVKWVIANTKTDFSLESLSNCFRYNGYRYLFYLYGKEPLKSFVDQNFFWLYDKLPSEKHPEAVVVMVAEDYSGENYQKYKGRELKSKDFGSFEVIIADNTKGILYDF